MRNVMITFLINIYSKEFFIMAYSGKLSGNTHVDVYNQIVEFLTDTPAIPGRDWTVVKSETADYGPRTVLKNTGTLDNDNIYIGLYCFTKDSTNGGIFCRVYTHFTENMSFDDAVYGNPYAIVNGSSTSYVDVYLNAFAPFWNNIMSFWIWSNKNRIIFVTNSNGIYSNAYLGKLKTSTFIPGNFVCISDAWGDSLSGNTSHTFYHTNGLSANYYYNTRHNLLFTAFGNRTIGTKTNNCHAYCTPMLTWTNSCAIIPTCLATTDIFGSESSDNIAKNPGISSTIDYAGNEQKRVLIPSYVALCGNNNNQHKIAGQLDGVYWCPDGNNISESLVDNHVVFPDINRVNWYSFMAIGDN